ncbi:hypothetical protein DFJ73DRAFT_197722 [Zopfochytrium polystomum]|nr:hypothetical protein DFJ73DRAFT_197722 [Zopfochytrium polystomum]
MSAIVAAFEITAQIGCPTLGTGRSRSRWRRDEVRRDRKKQASKQNMPTNVSSFPDCIVSELLARLPIPDLWAATKASAAWRRVAESAGQSVWRRSLFSTYYRGNTFAARLPAGDVWPLDIADDDEPPARGRPRPWPASPASPGSGGTESVTRWTRVDEDEDVLVVEQEHAVAAAAAAYTWTGGELPENSRVRTLCEDFANTDIRSFFAGAPSEAECRAKESSDKALVYLGWLSDAGRAGWKAFALRVFYGCDLTGRRLAAALEKDELIARERLDELDRLEANAWRPCPGTFPLHFQVNDDCWDPTDSHISLLLVYNRDLSPGVAVLTYEETVHDCSGEISVSCRAYLGPNLGLRLDFCALRCWTKSAWNRFFTLMFLCNSDRSGIALHDLVDCSMSTFDTAPLVSSLRRNHL